MTAMEEKDIIRVQHVTKEYTLGQFGGRTLQHDLQSWWAAVRGKEDPNAKIGSDPRLHGTRFEALSDISLTVKKGESLGIIGENGAGKSTLLKILSQITAPTKGRVDLYGRVTSMLEVGTGFDGEMTGLENIYLSGSILGMKKKEIDAKLDAIVRFAGLEEFLNTPVKRYSSGMYTRLGFSVAAHLDSEIMIMVEVLAVGDAEFQNKCISRMKEAVEKEGRTVLCVSHNMGQIRRLCNRCAVLKKGRLRYIGDVGRAIEIYMNESLAEESVKIDYRNFDRPGWLTQNRMRLESAAYRNLDSIFCPAEKDPEIRLVFECFEEIRGLSLRVEMKDTNDQRLGTYVFYDLCDCAPGRRYELDLSLDVSPFAEGTYRCVYCFFVRDAAGTNLNEDRVPGLTLTKGPSAAAGGVRWDRSEWGSLSLPGGTVRSFKELSPSADL